LKKSVILSVQPNTDVCAVFICC